MEVNSINLELSLRGAPGLAKTTKGLENGCGTHSNKMVFSIRNLGIETNDVC